MGYQSIITKYIPCTNTRGSRIKAETASGLSVTIPYPHEYSGADCHFQAVKELLKKQGLKWSNEWYCSSLKNGYVFIPKDSEVFSIND